MGTFQIPLSRPAHLTIPRLRAEAEQHGLTWHGDDHEGHVAGHGFTAHYTIQGEIMTVHYKKPYFFPIPDMLIQEKLRALLSRV